MEKATPSKSPVVQQIADEASGHSMVPPAFQLQASPVSQLQEDNPPGRGLCTRFGDYWIVPDDTNQCYAGVEGEQITETEFAALQTAWDALVAGTGKIVISETDDAGTEHAGFKENMLNQFGKLMSQPTGRGLVVGLINGTQVVTIRPTERQQIAFARRGAGTLENADGTANTGGTTTIYLDDNLTDDKVVAFDAAGNEIASPVFLILGHELIHAVHNAAGRNKRNTAASSPEWGNMEEEVTIATGDLTENDIRAEHNLGVRHGHRIRVNP